MVQNLKQLTASRNELNREVAERLVAENELRQSESRFRTVIAASSDAMIAASERGKITLFNPAAEAMYERAVEADPKHANNLGNFAWFLHDQKKDYPAYGQPPVHWDRRPNCRLHHRHPCQ